MRPVLFVASLSAAFALAGCHREKSVDMKNASADQVASAAASSGLHFDPGRWETEVTVDKFDMGGEMPPQAKAAMAGAMGKVRHVSACLTKEEAEQPKPKFFGGAGNGCQYDHFTMGGGAIDAKLTCKGESSPMAVTTAMSGHYSSDSYEMKVNSSGTQGPMPITMAMTMTAHRVGECTGNEDK